MSRRERTTALPRQRVRTHSHTSGRKFLGRTWGESEGRLAILGVSLLFLFFVVSVFTYRWYDERFQRPNHVVLSVGEDKIKLTYYADRLYEFALANAQVPVPVLESSLLAKLEEESLTVQVARDRGIELGEGEVTQAIAAKLGVPVGGDGSPFDTRYRAELKRVGMSDGNYRRLATAELADSKLRERVTTEVGDTGDTVTLRAIASKTKEESDAILARINKGDNMGTIAQTESLDLGTRQTDGVQSPAPAKLLPKELQAELTGKNAGALFGPVEIAGQFWLFRVEALDPKGAYDAPQKQKLQQVTLDEVIAAKKRSLSVVRSLNADDATWARAHTNGDPASAASSSGTTTTR